jgi:hypothetical protein
LWERGKFWRKWSVVTSEGVVKIDFHYFLFENYVLKFSYFYFCWSATDGKAGKVVARLLNSAVTAGKRFVVQFDITI